MIMEIKDTTEIEGGFIVPTSDSHLGAWQIEAQRLDHDSFLPSFFCNKMSEGNVVIDGGGYDGDHTIAYSNAVGTRGVVVAIEAGSLAYKCLVHNAKLFRYKNVLAIQAALGEMSGLPAKHHSNPNVGASTIQEMAEDMMVQGETYIRTISIDTIRMQIDKKIDFIKLDVEGCEVKALVGAANTLRVDRPKLMIEVNSGALEKQGDSVKDLHDALTYFKYTYEIIQPDCKEGDPQYDIFCKPAPEIIAPENRIITLN